MSSDTGSDGFSDRNKVLGFAAAAAADGRAALVVVPRTTIFPHHLKARMEETVPSKVVTLSKEKG